MNARIKQREIHFDALHPDPNQAQSAMLLLTGRKGMKASVVRSPCLLQVSYDVAHLTLDDILQELSDSGFHINNRLLCKLMQALYSYTEQTQQANLNRSYNASTRDMFISRYRRRPHGCRDQRPHHWRNYL